MNRSGLKGKWLFVFIFIAVRCNVYAVFGFLRSFICFRTLKCNWIGIYVHYSVHSGTLYQVRKLMRYYLCGSVWRPIANATTWQMGCNHVTLRMKGNRHLIDETREKKPVKCQVCGEMHTVENQENFRFFFTGAGLANPQIHHNRHCRCMNLCVRASVSIKI